MERFLQLIFSGKEVARINKMMKIMIPVIIVLFILIGITVLEFFVLHLLGLQYESVGALILFFVLYLLLEVPLSLITDALPKALKSVGVISTSKGGLPLFLDTGLTFILIILLDAFMRDITITWHGAIIFSFITGLISRKLKEREKEPPVMESNDLKKMRDEVRTKKET